MLRALQRGLRPATGTSRLIFAAAVGQATRSSAVSCSRPARHLSTSPSVWYPSAATQITEDLEPGLEDAPVEDFTPTVLRPYQTEAIEACLASLRKGKRRLGVSSPTGSGKTTMFMKLIEQIPSLSPSEEKRFLQDDDTGGIEGNMEEGGLVSRVGRGGQVLILVGGIQLASQAEEAARRILGPTWFVEVEQGQRTASGRADVTVATVQTLTNPRRLQKFDPGRFKLVIVDEAHHAAALSYLRLLHHFNDEVQLPRATGPVTTFDHGHKVPIIGFSATFSRHDTLALSSVFEEIVFHRDLGFMLKEGWLSPIKATSVYADLHLDDVETTNLGDYRMESLAQHVNTASVSRVIIGTYLKRAAERRATLVFAVNLAHVAALVKAFRHAGVDARSISSTTRPREREATIEDFQAGKFPVLVNCEVLTEGTDIPQIDCVILARPTKSKNLLAQMVGRGLRQSKETGKEDCYVIDIADNISRASGVLVSPTLFGLSHDDVEGEDKRKLKGAPMGVIKPPNMKVDKITMVDSSDPFGLDSTTSKTVIRQASHNAWVSCGGNRYVLELITEGFMTIERITPSSWSVTWTNKLPPPETDAPRRRSPYARPRDLASAHTLERAFETADTFAAWRLGKDLYKQVSRYAIWRSRPASGKQVAMLLKCKGVEDTDGTGDREISILGRRVMLSALTAGMVASYMTAFKHGAKGTRDKLVKAAEKEEKRVEKEELAAARNLPLPTMGRKKKKELSPVV